MDSVSPYVLLAVSMAANLIANTANKVFSSKRPSSLLRSAGVACISLVSCAVLFVWGGFNGISAFSLALGCVFGLVTFILNLMLLTAFELGPWSYTSVIASLSMLIPAFSGAVFWHEKIGPTQYIGTALVVVCIILSVDRKSDEKKANARWFVCTAVAFFMNGSIGVMQKWHQNSPYAGELNEFLIVSFGVGFACAAGYALLLSFKDRKNLSAEKKEPYPLSAPVIALLFLLSGAGTATIHKLNLYLSGVLPGAVFFPVVNGGALVLTSVAAFVFFREKLSKKQWVGLVVGIAAVLLLTL